MSKKVRFLLTSLAILTLIAGGTFFFAPETAADHPPLEELAPAACREFCSEWQDWGSQICPLIACYEQVEGDGGT